MSAEVPRRAAFDDLRVGQLVAVCDPDDELDVWGGRITNHTVSTAYVDSDGDVGMIDRSLIDRGGEVTILRDVPAPPVTVRREDYDALREAALKVPNEPGTHSNVMLRPDLLRAARTLIDNADTGADQ